MAYYAVTLEFDKISEKKMQEMIEEVARVTGCGQMVQQKIPPHVGIALKLTPKALDVAFDIVRERFTPFEAVVERIVLVKAEPYEEMQAWELRD